MVRGLAIPVVLTTVTKRKIERKSLAGRSDQIIKVDCLFYGL